MKTLFTLFALLQATPSFASLYLCQFSEIPKCTDFRYSFVFDDKEGDIGTLCGNFATDTRKTFCQMTYKAEASCGCDAEKTKFVIETGSTYIEQGSSNHSIVFSRASVGLVATISKKYSDAQWTSTHHNLDITRDYTTLAFHYGPAHHPAYCIYEITKNSLITKNDFKSGCPGTLVKEVSPESCGCKRGY